MNQSPPALLDHVVINARNQLDYARDRYERLGFCVTERGHHPFGSSNHLMVFGDTFAELLGLEAGRESLRPDLMAFPFGLTGLVLRTADAQAQYQALVDLGLAGEAPLDFRRQVTIAGAQQEAHFQTVRLRADLVRNGRTFFCQHFTPQWVWRDEWRRHPNGADEIVGFIIASDEPASQVALYRSLFPHAEFSTTEGHTVLHAGHARVEFLTYAQANMQFGPIEAGSNGSERMVALRLHTPTLSDLPRLLSHHGIASHSTSGRGIYVQASEACGVALHFVNGEQE